MKVMVEKVEYCDEVSHVTLRFGDISINDFLVQNGGIISYPESVEIPYELQKNVRNKLIGAHAQMKKNNLQS